jgi:glutamate 5-kinase
VDDGAKRALVERNTSLLPSGVKQSNGNWEAGEVVRIVGLDRREIARGVANVSSREMEKIRGLKTADARKVLGYASPDEVVHRDNLVRVDEEDR